MEKFDIIIIGGGPAGLTAAIYALRANKKVLLIEDLVFGGAVGTTYEIKNYPGFESIAGPDLAQKMSDHAISLGLKTKSGKVLNIYKTDDGFNVLTQNEKFAAGKIIICTGAKPKPLNVQINKSLIGKGISYCATCDGNFYKNKTVAVVGAGNTAFENAKYLCGMAKKVYIVHRGEKFRAQKALEDEIKEFEKKGIVEFKLNSTISEILGADTVSAIVIENVLDKTKTTLEVDGVFVAIGLQPDTDWLVDFVDLDDYGYIIVDKNMETSIKGIYAAGDVVSKEVRQIVTACSDGAIAGTKASQ